MLTGCPGLQFRFGNKCILFPVLILIMIFCVPLAVIIPAVVGLFFGIAYPYKILADLWYAYTRGGRHDKRISYLAMFAFALIFF